MSETAEPLFRIQLAADQLMAEHPPRVAVTNKRAVFDIAVPPGTTHTGTIECTRWPASPLPEMIPAAVGPAPVVVTPDLFEYGVGPPETMAWHLNFAHSDLFVAYASSLFAQDEMQVAEHPALGAVREALVAKGLEHWTRVGNEPTPILITGVERRCRIATAPDAAAGRPNGLYGNAFARASAAAVRAATTAILPPTISNIIAMEAPTGGSGRYSGTEITSILTTACTGFRAAVNESRGYRTIIHTGFWGCGAYGGDRELMGLLQLLAARAAGVHTVRFHAFDSAGVEVMARALRMVESFGAGELPTASIIQRVVDRGYAWGVSDGN